MKIHKIRFHTNLDECKREEWPVSLPRIPVKGDRVVSKNGITLEVVCVTFDYKRNETVIELHMPSFHRGSIREFCDAIIRFKESPHYGPAKRETEK